MTTYALYVIDHTTPISLDEYNTILTGKPHHYFDKLRDVFEFCGGKLRRGRLGYAGLKGNTEYVAFKIVI
jgi:hypothetical protein